MDIAAAAAVVVAGRKKVFPDSRRGCPKFSITRNAMRKARQGKFSKASRVSLVTIHYDFDFNTTEPL
jgi:hypothetical protein